MCSIQWALVNDILHHFTLSYSRRFCSSRDDCCQLALSLSGLICFRKPPKGHEKDTYKMSITVNGEPLGGGNQHTYCWSGCKLYVSLSFCSSIDLARMIYDFHSLLHGASVAQSSGQAPFWLSPMSLEFDPRYMGTSLITHVKRVSQRSAELSRGFSPGTLVPPTGIVEG